MLEICTGAVRQEKEIKGTQIGKEEVYCPLFAGHVSLYFQKNKDSSKRLLEPINKFSLVTGYKINQWQTC